ncbi:unnamed protein product [Spodoptera exigua]|nr:unnamed protein product [Spodoptera exigua]
MLRLNWSDTTALQKTGVKQPRRRVVVFYDYVPFEITMSGKHLHWVESRKKVRGSYSHTSTQRAVLPLLRLPRARRPWVDERSTFPLDFHEHNNEVDLAVSEAQR